MAYVARTQEEILAELQELSTLQASKVEGTFENDVFASNAIEFQKVELELNEMYNAAFGHLTWGDYLTLKAGEFGVTRRPANKAIGAVVVTGKGTVPAGSIFSTDSNIKFLATEETFIEDSGTVLIEAEVAGDSGNVAANTITNIPLNIVGINSCTNPEATYDGYDEESDTVLKNRFLTKVRYPAASGNPRQYVEWATSVVGVGAARCIRCWQGAGTVKVIIVDSNFEEANSALLQRVYNVIETERPIGAEVTLTSAKTALIDVAAKVFGNVDVEKFKQGVNDYFSRITKVSLTNVQDLDSSHAYTGAGYVPIAQIGHIIIESGGADDYDYDSLTLNGENENYMLGVEDIPKLGEVTFT